MKKGSKLEVDISTFSEDLNCVELFSNYEKSIMEAHPNEFGLVEYLITDQTQKCTLRINMKEGSLDYDFDIDELNPFVQIHARKKGLDWIVSE